MPDNLHIHIVHLLQNPPPSLLCAGAPKGTSVTTAAVTAPLAAAQTLYFARGTPNTDFSAVRMPSFCVISQAYHLLVLLEQRAGEIKLRAAINRNQSEPGRDSTDELHHSRFNHRERVGHCGAVPNC